MSVTREKLYEEIWAEPATKVAPRYGVSANFLARVCDRLRVPRPERGYWAQLAVGKAPQRPSLPEALPGDELEWSRDGDARTAPRALPQPPAPRTETAPPASRRSRNVRHALLAGAREVIVDARAPSRYFDDGYQRPLKRRLVDLFVSMGALDRALAFANELFLSLEGRGHRVTFAPFKSHLTRPPVDVREKPGREYHLRPDWAPDRPTLVYVGTVAIGLSIFELSEEIEVKYVNGKYVPVAELPRSDRAPRSTSEWLSKKDMPSGRLCLRVTSPDRRATWEKQWREEGRTKLPGLISQIVLELEEGAVTLAQLVAEGERQAELERRKWEEQQERWRLQELERRRQENLKNSREELFGIIKAWGTAKEIEGFFEDTERRAESLGETEAAEVRARIARARELLGGINALERFRQWRAPDER